MFQKYVVLLKTNFCTMLRNNQKYFIVTAVKYSSLHDDYTHTHTHTYSNAPRLMSYSTYVNLTLCKFLLVGISHTLCFMYHAM
jgi:hypothetical protein